MKSEKKYIIHEDVMVINDETLLIKKAINGDSDAFGELVIKYQKFVFNICIRHLRNTEDAYDVSQEVFIKAFKSIGQFRNECEFSTWIYRISQNAIKDFINKEVKVGTIPLSAMTQDDDKNETIDIPDTDISYDPQASAEKKEMIAAVRKAISKLPKSQSEMIALRDIEGYTYEEISQMTGVEIGTVKSRINRARNNLKEILKNGNFFDITESNSTKGGEKSVF